MFHSLNRAAVLASVILMAGCGGCETKVANTFGVFVLTPQVLDYHTVCLNSTSEFSLSLRNDGQGLIKIKSFEFSDPAFALLSDMPPTIAPRQTVVVQIGFTPTEARSYTGFFTVETDTKKDPTQKATLLGSGFDGEDVTFEVSCECNSAGSSGLFCGLPDQGQQKQQPCYFLNFGDVIAGQTAEATLTLQNRGCQPVQFTQALFHDDVDPPADASLYTSWYSIDPVAPQTIRGGDSQKFAIRFSPTADASPTVRLTVFSNDPSDLRTGQTIKGAWDLGLFGNAVKPALFVDPPILTFFDTESGMQDSKTFIIDNTGTGTLHVDSVTLAEDNGTQDFALQIPNGSSFDLGVGQQATGTVTFTARGQGGRSGTVTVRAGSDQATVRLLGGIEPEISVTWLDPSNATNELPPPVDFGAVTTGDMATRTVRVHNIGRADLNISAMVANDITNAQPSTGYSVQSFSPATITPGGSKDFTVVFSDDVSIRDDLGKLAITSNDPLYAGANNQKTVDLKSQNQPNYAPIPGISFSPSSPTGCMPLTLDAGATTDPEGGAITYSWAIARKPAGSQITLTTPNAQTTGVTSPSCSGPDVAGNYVFTLTVVDQYPRNSVQLSQAVIVR